MGSNPRLQQIKANDTNLNNLYWLPAINSALTELDLSQCANLPSIDLTVFADCVQLEWLNISNCNFFGSLAAFSNCQQLRLLDIQQDLTMVIKSLIEHFGEQKLILSQGDYQMLSNGYLVPALNEKNQFVGKILEQVKNYIERIKLITLTRQGQAWAVSGQKVIVEKVTTDWYEDYLVQNQDYEFKVWRDKNYQPQVGDVWIVTDQEWLNYKKSLLIKDNQIKIFELKSDLVFETQPYLLTYQDQQIQINLNPNLKQQITYKEKFLTKLEDKLREEIKNQDLLQQLQQFYLAPQAEKIISLVNNLAQYWIKENEKEPTSEEITNFKKEWEKDLQDFLQIWTELQQLQSTEQNLAQEVENLQVAEVEQLSL